MTVLFLVYAVIEKITNHMLFWWDHWHRIGVTQTRVVNRRTWRNGDVPRGGYSDTARSKTTVARTTGTTTQRCSMRRCLTALAEGSRRTRMLRLEWTGPRNRNQCGRWG